MRLGTLRDRSRAGPLRASPDAAILEWCAAWPDGLCARCRAPTARLAAARARREVELAQDVRDVAVDGVLADHQPLGDLPVRQPFGEQRQHLALARRELGQAGRAVGGSLDAAAPARSASARHRARAGTPRPQPPRARPARRDRAPRGSRQLDPRPGLDTARRGLEADRRRPRAASARARARRKPPRARPRPGRRTARSGSVARPAARARAAPSSAARDLLEGRPASDSGVDQELERRRRGRGACGGSLAQQPLAELDRAGALAAVERQAGATELRRGRRARASSSARGLGGPALPAPQLGQAGERAGRPSRGASARSPRRRPRAAPPPRATARATVHGAVLGAAEGEHPAAAVALGERGDPVAPGERALEVVDREAGGDEKAARPGARDRDLGRALERGRPSPRRGGACPPRTRAPATSAAPSQREAEHLEVGDVEPAPERPPPRAPSARRPRRRRPPRLST